MQKLHCPIADLLPTVDTTLNKFVGDQKKKCDRAFIVWCYKAGKPLSMAEKDPHFRSFLYAITNGRSVLAVQFSLSIPSSSILYSTILIPHFYRYTPPCYKTCREELIVLVGASRATLKEEFQQNLEEDGLDLSISGG